MNAKVLIVDDSALARRLTRQVLEELGHSVEEATDGAQALERYAIHHHDVVVLDLVMPGMEGLEVLEKFRQLNPQVSVIVVTADIQKTTREQVKAAGAAAILNKPIDKQEFISHLEKVLSGGTAWS
jgi:CheY-like chemotaxis protein